MAHERAAMSHAGGAHGQRQRQRGQQPLRHEGDDDPDREQEPVGGRHPDPERGGEERDPGTDRHHRDGPHRPLQVDPERGRAAHNLAGEVADRAEPGALAGGDDHDPAAAAGHEGAGEDEVGRLGRVRRRLGERPLLTQDRLGFPGEGGVVDLQAMRHQHPGVGRDPVALGQQDDVAGNQLHRWDAGLLPAPQDDRGLGQECRQRLGGPLGAVFLGEREQAVDDDHHDDRPAELRQLPHEGEPGRRPQHEREEVGELRDELADRAGPLVLREQVRADPGQPRRGLIGPEPVGLAPDVGEHRVRRLHGHRQQVRGPVGRGHLLSRRPADVR
jgi:hypothetical protein